MKVKFKKNDFWAETPEYANTGDAGMDLTCTRVVEQNSKTITYGTGLAFEIPKGHVGLVFPRSSIRKYDLALTNSVGVIDSGYRGEIMFTFMKTKWWKPRVYKIGERLGQIVFLPYPKTFLEEVENLNSSDRDTKGFGSSGN